MVKIYQPFPRQALVFTCLQHRSFENPVGKGEIARNELCVKITLLRSTPKNF